MRHEWERGTTVGTPDSPPEGYSYCAYCSTAEDDDNADAECEMRFGFRPLVFDHEESSVKTVEGDVPLATMLTSSDFPCISEEDETRCDQEAEFYGQLFAVSPDLLSVVKDSAPALCSALCQSVWKTGERQPHHSLCERARAAIGRAEFNPFCDECGGAGEAVYALPGFSCDTEQSSETGECQTCEGTGRKPEVVTSQPASA